MKKILQTIKENYILIIVVMTIGLFLGWIIFHDSNESEIKHQDTELADGHDHSSDESVLWTCSMHPQIKQDKPGQCPICAMDLIPLTTMNTMDSDVNPDEIVMSAAAAKLASIQTMVVSREIPIKSIYLQGKVEADERNIAELTSRFGGRIEKLFINFTGQNVLKGEKLATIYSPALISAQRELLEALSSRENRPSLYNAARSKLKLWGLNDQQISNIEEKGEPTVNFDVLSPITGTVTMRHVALGDYVNEGTALFRLVDLKKVWVMFDAYESDLPWIKVGDRVDFTLKALPAQNFSARVTYIDPIIDEQVQVAKVRIEMQNQKMLLKPGMFASAVLESELPGSIDEIIVPKSSVLWTGKRAIVYIKVPEREDPTFKYREIILGPEAGNYFVVAEGLSEGEEIAVNGVFKIDASAQLIGLPSMMSPEGGMIRSTHNHGEMDDNTSIKDSRKDDETFFAPELFISGLTSFYDTYLVMKDAFVESDAVEVSSEASATLSSLEKIDMNLLSGNAHNKWMDSSQKINEQLQKIKDSNDIENQRVVFTSLNSNLYDVLKSFLPAERNVYWEFCPMANDNEGGYWFSDSEEIRNPYFGDMMLTCGEVKEVLGERK